MKPSKQTLMTSKMRIICLILSVACAVVIFCFSAVPASGLPQNMGLWSNVAHFSEYLVLAVLLTLGISHPSRKLWISCIVVVAIASAYGASDEFHQLFVTGRCTDVFDWLTDTLGASVGSVVTAVIIRIRR